MECLASLISFDLEQVVECSFSCSLFDLVEDEDVVECLLDLGALRDRRSCSLPGSLLVARLEDEDDLFETLRDLGFS